MGIFDRFSKVISSNVNSLLDKAEDPRKSVDLLIEEMREQIRRGRQEVVSAVAGEKQLREKVADLDQQVERWQQRAELAVKAADETLAREALRFKKGLVEQRDRAEALRAEQRGRALRMKDELAQAQTKLKELEARKGTIVARYEQGRAGGGADALGAKGDGPTPFDTLRRIEEKIDRTEAEAEAMGEARNVVGHPKTSKMSADELEARFAELEDAVDGQKQASASPGGDADIDAELAALSKKFRVAP
ncbi:MAG: PspA/IM30 family protein [Polyangiaceae bacterium]|jgi:phage shock protein A|nr:PspA/IM30 family protein [Polyangiaceae bacterium]